MRLRRADWFRLALTPVLGGWFLFFLAEISPHLVHHLFDDADDDLHGACAFFAAADHSPASSPPVVVPVPSLLPCGRAEPASTALPGAPPAPARATRGPPAASLASGPCSV